MFVIHPQLLDDCHLLGRLPECHLLLHRNACIPWFILVPETAAIELTDLPVPQRERVLDECRLMGDFLRNELGATKLNVAALGNVVSQLHLHVIGRHPADPCWPKPVWGNLPAGEPYPADHLQHLQNRLSTTLPLT